MEKLYSDIQKVIIIYRIKYFFDKKYFFYKNLSRDIYTKSKFTRTKLVLSIFQTSNKKFFTKFVYF